MTSCLAVFTIIKYIPLQQGLRLSNSRFIASTIIIKYIPLQQGLRHSLIP